MSSGWWSRAVANLAIALFALWCLLPSILGESVQEQLAKQAASAQSAAAGDEAAAAAAEPAAWWASFLPDYRIQKGIDIAGGIDLTLQVDVNEAVRSAVQRDVRPLLDMAESDNVAISEARRATGETVLLIRPGGNLGQTEVETFLKKRFSYYVYDGTRTVDGQEWMAFKLTDEQAAYVKRRSVEQALQTLRTRIDATGVKEPSIVLKGGERINVQLPGMDNVEQAMALLGEAAVLEFMMVEDEVEAANVDRALLEAGKVLSPEEFKNDERLSNWLVANGHIPSTTRLLWEYGEGAKKEERKQYYVVKDEVMLTGDDINDAQVAMNQYNEPYVALEFKPRGAKIFAEVTGENVGRFFAIVLDNKVSSAPRIREKIGGGRASIEMGVGDYQSAMREASTLSLVLRTGALPAPVSIGEVRTVGASLGADAIASGLTGAAFAGVLVFSFMILFYGWSGFVANLAMGLNVVLVMASLALVGASLTLPGIAGIALTIGMAVDCNIIFYERIREELRLGKTPRAAVDAGFDKALWAVLDANITTFIAGVVLYTYGTGPIKGFAVTLMLGIITTLITGIFTSRTMMDWLARKPFTRYSI